MPRASRFGFVGGHPTLDFINTVEWRLSQPRELIEGFSDLTCWMREAGLIAPRERRALDVAAQRTPKGRADALSLAIEVRELGYRLLDAWLNGQRPARADLGRLNRLSELHADTLEWSERGYVRVARGARGALDRSLHLLIRAVIDFLASPESRRVARCQDDRGCGWIFIDRSRAHARRWCSMAQCGNRAKARRHYHRSVEG